MILDMAVKISKKKILEMETSDILGKLSIVRDRIRILQRKYNMDFTAFQQFVENQEDEDFASYDDLLTWEGFVESERYLQQRLDELKNAKDIIVTE